jgi:hypothetical protein
MLGKWNGLRVEASPRWMSHPELVSGSVSESIKILKQVQDDKKINQQINISNNEKT